jgi:hypothetical protein
MDFDVEVREAEVGVKLIKNFKVVTKAAAS